MKREKKEKLTSVSGLWCGLLGHALVQERVVWME
jgi:hypothetical protein